MQLFKITNPNFTGEIEVLYNGKLVKFDCTNAQIDEETISAFKRAIPTNINVFIKGEWCSKYTTVVEAEYIVSFDMFWRAYDKKINKARAMPIFEKLTKTEQVKAYMGIKAYDKYLTKEKWRTKADPENYLRNKTWENEY